MGNPAVEDLNSIQARGQVAKTFIYFVIKGVQYKRPYVIPINTYTPRRRTIKNYFWQGSQAWNDLSVVEKCEWVVKATERSYKGTGYDLFMSKWLGGVIQVEIVRSVQNGRQLCNDGDNDITITAVAEGKSLVLVGSYSFGSAEGLAKSNAIKGALLTSATNLRIVAIKGVQAPQPEVMWQVIEFF